MTTAYVIRYHGAPYGDNEVGHIVSEHETYSAAEKAMYMMGNLAGRENDILERRADGYYAPAEEGPDCTRICDLGRLS